MQSQRLRMVSDSELRLEQFQAERKDEKRRYEDALDRLKQVLVWKFSMPGFWHDFTRHGSSIPQLL